MVSERGHSKTRRLHGSSREPRARHFIEHEHRWADGRRHVCAYDWPLPARFKPKSILLRWKLFVQPGTWDGERFDAGAIVRKAFPLEGVVVSKVVTQAGARPRICYGYDVAPHMFELFVQHIDIPVRQSMEARFEQEQAQGHCKPREILLHSLDSKQPTRALSRGRQVLQDLPVGEYQDPKLFEFIKRRVDAQVRKRFARFREEEFDPLAEKWPRRCFRSQEAFYDERLGELRLLPSPRNRENTPSLEERGATLTSEIASRLLSKSRQPYLGKSYSELHRLDITEERAAQMAELILDELLKAIPDLRLIVERNGGMRERLLEAIQERSTIRGSGSRPAHYRGEFFLARHIAAIAIGVPEDGERRVRAREDLISRRMEYRDGKIRRFVHARRRLS